MHIDTGKTSQKQLHLPLKSRKIFNLIWRKSAPQKVQRRRRPVKSAQDALQINSSPVWKLLRDAAANSHTGVYQNAAATALEDVYSPETDTSQSGSACESAPVLSRRHLVMGAAAVPLLCAGNAACAYHRTRGAAFWNSAKP